MSASIESFSQRRVLPFDLVNRFDFHFSRVTGLLTIATCALVLVGWAAGIPQLTRVAPVFPPATPLTAVLLMILAFPLVMSKGGPNPFAKACCRRMFIAVSMVAGTASLWILLEYLNESVPKLEQLLFWESISLNSVSLFPGRPSPQTAVAAILCAATIGALAIDRPLARVVADVFTAFLLIGSWIILFAYATLAAPLFTLATPLAESVSDTGVSAFTAIGFLLLGCGFAGLRRHQGLFDVLGSSTSGGIVVRSLMPVALLLPIFLGWFIFWRTELHPSHFWTTIVLLMAFVSLAFTLGLVWVGHLLKKQDLERSEDEEKREELLQNLLRATKELEKARKNLVTVCAWSNQVLDKGQWVRFEDYLYRRLGIQVTHGICEESMMDQLNHAGSYSLPKAAAGSPLEQVEKRRKNSKKMS